MEPLSSGWRVNNQFLGQPDLAVGRVSACAGGASAAGQRNGGGKQDQCALLHHRRLSLWEPALPKREGSANSKLMPLPGVTTPLCGNTRQEAAPPMGRVPVSVVSTNQNVVISEETILRVNALNCCHVTYLSFGSPSWLRRGQRIQPSTGWNVHRRRDRVNLMAGRWDALFKSAPLAFLSRFPVHDLKESCFVSAPGLWRHGFDDLA